jgi:archaemetzincin
MVLSDGLAVLCAALALSALLCRRRRERRDPLARLTRGGLLDLAILIPAVASLASLCCSVAAPRRRPAPAAVATSLPGPAPALIGRDGIERGRQQLLPLAQPLPRPQPGDWRFIHHERAQTFSGYLAQHPVTANSTRTVLYIQPIGVLAGSHQRVLQLTARFMRSFFCRPVQVLQPISLDEVPSSARRQRLDLGAEQLLTGYLLERVLLPRLPRDAVAMLGLTVSDLWPGRGWNFVFGEASLSERVGVWSLHRMGKPEAGAFAFRNTLLRTLKLAAHETGHMFSIEHCVLHQCLMNGSNSLPETDSQPISLCPECWAKLNWAARCDPSRRLQELESFFVEVGLPGEAARFRAKRAALESGVGSPAWGGGAPKGAR